MPKIVAWGLGLVFVLAACSGGPIGISKNDRDFSERFVALLKAKEFDQIESLLDPRIKTSTLRDTMERAAGLFPADDPTDVQLINWYQVFVKPVSGANSEHLSVEFQYQFKSTWLLVDMGFSKENSQILIDQFNISPLPDSLANINRFSLWGKDPAFYAFLGLAVLVPLFIAFTAILCAVTPMKRRKWLWLLFILLGFGQLSLNWTNGSLYGNLAFIQFLGGGWSQGGLYGPVFVHLSLPVGAIIFLIHRRRLDRRNGELTQDAAPFRTPPNWN